MRAAKRQGARATPQYDGPLGQHPIPHFYPCLPEKAPSPIQLSVVELPGDAVKLSWVAAALSGVLVYQIKWMPLGEGKAHEVRKQGQKTFQRNSYGPRSQNHGRLRLCVHPSPVSWEYLSAIACDPASGGEVPYDPSGPLDSPFFRSLSQGPLTQPSYLA